MAGKGKNKAVVNTEDDSENWCFVCKDGGDIRICDYKQCIKAYHPQCVGKKDSFLESEKKWDCPWHRCSRCSESSYLRCYTCPNATCRHCLPDAEILRIKGMYGLCEECLNLALLIEGKREYDSDEGSVDFTDPETEEGLFMEYYTILKHNEGFELADIYAAKKSVTPKKNDQSESGSEDFDHGKEEEEVSDYSDMEVEKSKHQKRCRRSNARKTGRPNKKEFTGWASRSLIDFLNSIGKITTEKLSQDDVTAIVHDYAKENKLLHTVIKCDAQLQSLFKKRTINGSSVYDHLEDHFFEDRNELEEDKVGYVVEADNAVGTINSRKRQRKTDLEKKTQENESEKNYVPIESRFTSTVVENHVRTIVACKRQRKTDLEKKTQEKESEKNDVPIESRFTSTVVENNVHTIDACKRQRKAESQKKKQAKEPENNVVPVESRFASLVLENFELVHLKRSVLKELHKEPESFEEKVTGCFVLLKPKYHPIQVKGVKILSTDVDETVLLLSAEPKEIKISGISDTYMTERDFDVLRRKMLAGEVERPTVEYLQQKARSIHKEMTTIMLCKDRMTVDALITKASCVAGWRDILIENREKKKRLDSDSEYPRRLQNVPTVIPDMYTPVTDCNEGPPVLNPPRGSVLSDDHQGQNKPEENAQHGVHTSASDKREPTAENPSSAEPQKCCTPKSKVKRIDVIDIMIEDKGESAATPPAPAEANPETEVWCVRGPAGERNKSELGFLRQWSSNSSYAHNFMAWKEDWSEEDAIPLLEALSTASSKM